jgi:alkanesulfonate monooxygenase SsuD/methylene tetrahydromethanopterin reductase-like flavin-dependent oxidoreductase (luciferase family)
MQVTGICLVIESRPIVLAKEVASLNRISDGRVGHWSNGQPGSS